MKTPQIKTAKANASHLFAQRLSCKRSQHFSSARYTPICHWNFNRLHLSYNFSCPPETIVTHDEPKHILSKNAQFSTATHTRCGNHNSVKANGHITEYPRTVTCYDLLTPPAHSFKQHSSRPHDSSHNLPIKQPSPTQFLYLSLPPSLVTVRTSDSHPRDPRFK